LLINNQTLSEQTYEELSKMILNNRFTPGEKITEEHVAKLLGVSRTTVKKAFTTLVKEGVLEDIPRKGVFIKMYSDQEILEIYDLREIAAGLCARYAAMNVNKKDIESLESIYKRMKKAIKNGDNGKYAQCDLELHEAVVRFSEASILPELISSFKLRLRPFNVVGVRDPQKTILEHRSIIDSLIEGTPDMAEKVMRDHIKTAKTYFKSDKRN